MRRLVFWGVAAAALAIILLFATQGRAGSSLRQPSIVNRTPWGLSAAFAHLREQGFDARAFRLPVSEIPGREGCIVIACPVRVPPTATDMRFLGTWMETGGTVVLLTSPRDATPADEFTYFAVGVQEIARRKAPPWRWSSWQEWRRTRDTLHRRATAPFEPAEPVTWMRNRDVQFGAGPSKQWFSNLRGELAVAVRPKGRGRLVVVDNVTMFANAWVGENGNAAFLVELFDALDLRDRPIHFAEWLQGERDLTEASNPLGLPSFIMLLHLGALYLAAVWSFSRRFGPPMGLAREPGSDTRRWLLALAGIHAEKQHVRAGGRALGRHASQVLPPDDPLRDGLNEVIRGDDEYVERARSIAARLGSLRQRVRRGPRDAAGEEAGE